MASSDETVIVNGISRSGLVLGVVGALLAVLVVVAIVLALQPADSLDPGTPEATVQNYLQAVIDSDEAEAAALMTPDLAERCGADLVALRHAPDSFRAVIVDTESLGTDAIVTVEITEGSGSGLLGDSWTFDESFVLEPVGTEWLIAESPWPIYCGEA